MMKLGRKNLTAQRHGEKVYYKNLNINGILYETLINYVSITKSIIRNKIEGQILLLSQYKANNYTICS